MTLSRLREFFRHKLSAGIVWTTASFAVLAASGILINLVISYFRNAEDLGVFNLAYSVYIIVSQIAVFGIHYSVLRNAAHHAENRAMLGAILGSAIAPVLVLGLIWTGVIFALKPWLVLFFDSERAARSIAVGALGITLFPVTKVLISFLNGLQEMEAFAILQAGRYIIVASVATVFAISSFPFEYASICFLIAELVTLLAAGAYIFARSFVASFRIERTWLSYHLTFGGKCLAAGMFGELNTRVDVLILGSLLSDGAVGIYSFAAMLLDGLYHLLAMVRVNFNPLLVKAVRDHTWPDAQKILRISKTFVPLIMGVLALCVFTFYWIVTMYFIPERGLQEGLVVLFILLSGLVVTSGLIPFDNLLLVSGHPGYQTFQQVIAFLANVIGNVALIPILGLEGAAIGTACSYVAATLVLVLMSKKLLGWNLITNSVHSHV